MSTIRLSFLSRMLVFGVTIIALLATNSGGIYVVKARSDLSALQLAVDNVAIVFVSRNIPGNGSVYYPATGSLPGVQAYSRFQVSAPGKLLVREANGTIRALIDGSNPTAASLNLIDVNAPDVSYDATKVVFAGLTAGSYSTAPMTNPGAWRLYIINVDGTGLRQLTFSDRNINLSQFGGVSFSFVNYDDTDPVWLPDGRLVFSSTRWPSFGMYGGARTSNLYVINADGTGMHRITGERNGADRPLVDPLTGKIVYSRWWRNARMATDSMATIPHPQGGYIMKDGLCAAAHAGVECAIVGGDSNLQRNYWQLASINPDGTGLAQFAGRSGTTDGLLTNHAYGGVFASDGSLYANFFPMSNGTEAAGFGGIRHYQRGPKSYTPVIGITHRDESVLQFANTNPKSYGVYIGNYATEPEVLPDGSLIISWAKDVTQDYGLYTINPDGSNLTKLYDNPGTTELRTRLIRPRPIPPIIPDRITKVASLLPPLAEGPYDIDGTFTFQALNVYFNAPVDVDIINAIPVGSGNTIRFFIDHQRSQQTGSISRYDWPILLEEVLIDPDGSVTANSPANVPLFEQIRSKQPGYTVPLTGSNVPPWESPGAAHVAGENFGRPGQVVKCVGCHAGHTMIAVPSNPDDAQWTNLATGAAVTVSSTGGGSSKGINDRLVKMNLHGDGWLRYWISNSGSPNTQWVQLTFPVPVTVRTVRLYNPASVDSSIKVLDSTVRLFSDAAGTVQVASNNSGALSDSGTNVNFNEVLARVVRIQFNSVNGSAAALGEVEVIARGEAENTVSVPTSTVTSTPVTTVTSTSTGIPLTSQTPTSMPTSGSVPSSTPTSTFTSVPAFTSTSVPPTYTAIPIGTATSAIINTATFTPIATNTQVVTALPSSIKVLALASLSSRRGTTSGSISSLGLLQQKGIEDDPAAYVAFLTPNKAYQGYQSFYLPGDITPSLISSMVLDVNYKAPVSSIQTWSFSIYNWKTRRWIKLGTMNGGKPDEWFNQVFTIPSYQKYISSRNEIRLQLRSNNGKGDLKVDYEVIKITTGVLPTATFTPTYTPSPTPTP